MHPTDIIFQTASNLTGGLVTDATTLVIALVTLGFMVIGLEILTEPLLSSLKQKRYERELDRDYDDYARKRLKMEIFKKRYEQDRKDLDL